MTHRGRKNADTILLAELAAGQTRAKAAERAGVSPSTVARRMRDPDFQRELKAARQEMLEEATGRLAYASSAAVVTLAQLLQSTSPTARLGAARSILEYGIKLTELYDLQQRVEELEARLNQQQEGVRRWG